MDSSANKCCTILKSFLLWSFVMYTSLSTGVGD